MCVCVCVCVCVRACDCCCIYACVRAFQRARRKCMDEQERMNEQISDLQRVIPKLLELIIFMYSNPTSAGMTALRLSAKDSSSSLSLLPLTSLVLEEFRTALLLLAGNSVLLGGLRCGYRVIPLRPTLGGQQQAHTLHIRTRRRSFVRVQPGSPPGHLLTENGSETTAAAVCKWMIQVLMASGWPRRAREPRWLCWQ